MSMPRVCLWEIVPSKIQHISNAIISFGRSVIYRQQLCHRSHFTNLHTVRRFYHVVCRSSNEPACIDVLSRLYGIDRPIRISTIGIFVYSGNKNYYIEFCFRKIQSSCFPQERKSDEIRRRWQEWLYWPCLRASCSQIRLSFVLVGWQMNLRVPVPRLHFVRLERQLSTSSTRK